MRSTAIHKDLCDERWLIVSSFACGFGAGYLPLLVLPWTYGALVMAAGYSPSKAGLLASLEILALAAASIAVSRRATLSGRRHIALISVLLAAAANILAAVVQPHGLAFLGLRTLSGAALGAAAAIGTATAAGARNPTRAFGLLWLLFALWQLLIFNLAPSVIAHGGLAGCYVLMALACLLFLPLVLCLPDPRSMAEGPSKTRGPRPATRALILLAFLGFWLRDALAYSMSERLAADSAISGEALGHILGAAALIAVSGPALATRWANHSILVLAGGLLGALLTSGTMVLASSPGLFTCAALLMPSTGFFASALLSGTAAAADPTGRLAALGASVGFMSEAVGPALGGWLMEVGGRPALGITIGTVGLATLAAAVCAAAGSDRAPTARSSLH